MPPTPHNRSRFSGTLARTDESARSHVDNECCLEVVFQLDVTPEGKRSLVYISPTIEELIGISSADLMDVLPSNVNQGGWTSCELIHPEDRASFATSIDRARREQTRWQWTGRIQPIDGPDIRWVRACADPVPRPDGTVRWNGFAIDITETRQTTTALYNTRKRYQTLFESAGDAMFVMRGQEFIDCNPKAVRLFGCADASDLIGHSPWEFSPAVQPDGQPSQAKAKTIIERALRGDAQRFYWQHLRQDGTPFDAEVTLTRLRLDSEVIIQAIVRDVTPQRQTQRALRESEERWQQLAEYHPDGLIITVGTEVRYVNPSGAEVYGAAAPEALIGQSVYDLYRTELHERLAARKKRLDARKATPPMELTITGIDGQERIIESRAVPITFEGQPAALSVVRDVTDRRRAEQALKTSERNYRLLAEHATDVISRHAPGGTVLYISPSVRSLLGYEPVELIGRDIAKLIHPKDTDSIIFDPSNRPTTQYRVRRSDGSYIWLETTSKTLRNSEGEIDEIIAISRDVSDRVKREKRLEHQSIRLRLVNKISAAIIEAETPEEVAQAVLNHLNALVPFFSASITEYDLKANHAIFVARLPEAEAPDALRHKMPLDQGPGLEDVLQGELVYERDLGAHSHLTEAQQALYEWGARSYVLVPAMADGTVAGALNVTRERPHGFSEDDRAALREVARLLALALQHAHYRQALLSAKERAEAAQRESEQARAKAEQLNQLKTAFLANMSHEIRTPLTSIIGFTEVLEGMELEPPANRFVNLIHRGGDRLLETLNSVLDLSQLEAGAMQLCRREIRVDTVIRGVAEGFTRRASEVNVDLHVDLPPDPVRAYLDEAAVQRITTNLLSNAIKFTGEGTRPGGRVTATLRSHAEHVTIEISDTGVGIAPDFIPHLFDSFKQESVGDAREFEGSGLGLTITKRLVDLMDGTIEVDSVKGEGATFTVRLPVQHSG